MASAAGIAARTLARIERGQQAPSPKTLRRLAGVLEISLVGLAPGWAVDEEERVRSGLVAPGVAIRVFRKRRGLTLSALGSAVGVSGSLLSRFERGILAPKSLTAIGDRSFGAWSSTDLVITDQTLAIELGFDDAKSLTLACYAIETE